MAFDPSAVPALAASYASREPQEILALALKEYSPDIGISFSGAEDVVLIDMASKLDLPFKVFSLDTG
ncbi:MAG: phosphoadenosine phosphosulfate reductase, partial [Acidobacteria bacterium]